jgi:hypothetical protein
MYLVVRASYARFYAALGLDTGTMPVDAGTLVLATGYAIVLFAVVLLVLLGAFATGAALVPWSERTRADLPAVALFVVLGFAGMVGISLLPGSVSDTVAVLFPVVTLGAVSRMTGREGQWRIIMGLLAGLAATAGVIGLGWAVGIWSGSMTWLIATLFASAIAVIFVLARWTGRELRRSGLRPADDTTPATVLSQMNPIASIVAVIRERMTAGEAHRAVLGVAVGAVVMPAVTLWQLAYLVGSAADAGAAAREYGYVPDDYATATMWSTPVAPATVTLHRPGTDPIGVCGASPPWAASLISRDDTGSWVLLRPIEPGVATAEVVRLAAADYTVRPVLDEDIRQGRPWTVRAC